MLKVIKSVLCSISILFLVWFAVSYIDIVLYNLDGGSDHMWNLFNILVGVK